MEGWIKLHRQIQENEFYYSEKFTKQSAWIDLLLLATHTERTVYLKGVEIKLTAGQLCYSQVSLAKRWKWDRKTVAKYLETLRKRKMVDTRKSNITTIITIKKWYLYQVGTQRNGQRKDSGFPTNKNDKNDIIVLAKLLIKNISKEPSLYSIVGKYNNSIGEERLKGILADCIKRGNEFRTEEQLAGYLNTCSKSNGNASPELSFNPIEVNNERIKK